MKTSLTLVLLTLTPACFAQTEAAPAPAPVCGWQDNPETFTETCPAPFAFSSVKRFEQVDELTACWFYDTVCSTAGATPPDACRRAHVDCQPSGEARVGRP